MLYAGANVLKAVLLLPFATTLLAFHARGNAQLWSIAVAFCLNILGAAFSAYLLIAGIGVAVWFSIRQNADFVDALFVIFSWFIPFRNASVALLSVTTFLNVWSLARLWRTRVPASG